MEHRARANPHGASEFGHVSDRDIHRIQRIDHTRPVEWGEPLGYVTDDRDLALDRLTVLWVSHGPNGDYYVTTTRLHERPMFGVRLCTSGGASSRNPELVTSAADMYRDLHNDARREFALARS
jgi:hypothetical protein